MSGDAKNVGERPHRVLLQNPGPVVPDGDGGKLQSWFDLNPPAMFASIEPASTASLERVAPGNVQATATHIVGIPFHPQVTTKSRVLFNGRRFNVTGVSNPGERSVNLWLVCVENLA